MPPAAIAVAVPEVRGGVALAVVVVSPAGDGSVLLEGDGVPLPRGDCDSGAKVSRYSRLSLRVV